MPEAVCALHRYGQVERFAGALLRHFTVANGTGECRVSLDARVLALALYDPASPITIVPETGVAAYAPGDYYAMAEKRGDGTWSKVLSGRIGEKHGFPFTLAKGAAHCTSQQQASPASLPVCLPHRLLS